MRSFGIVIPWCNRPELAVTLARNGEAFSAHECSVAIVNCGGEPGTIESLVRDSGVAASVLHVTGARFNRSLALNLGIARAAADDLFLLDADLIVSPETIAECRRAIDSSRVLTIARMRETEPQPWLKADADSYLVDVMKLNAARFVFRDGRSITAPTFRSYAADGSRGGQGQVVVARENLVRVGGYNSCLAGWGYEDVDILVRLQHALDLRHEQVGEVIHLSHGDGVRDLRGTTRTENDHRNFRICCGNYARGNFQGSLAEDTAAYQGRMCESRIENH